ncbi:dTDP-4-dehydrorhamnose reductase [Candidatus Mycolicibacterium alkanivorans]|uniref:dTDP-4-dehydrorhamnose reductase n=1 Tax=Candidatus Mycolicibacterium alkanivorans TaxID=2954114 RepID=A0ABS9YZY9_9MYCO|nr:dTDP-4-dehydrorhamnose reductase [Candidatus Mycolicibacterium alkanivorans]MCI4676827.1 dTDP-4-dehydrorhamnose reductase [Candidatus Mycolicibacterium alkanivorans]
MTKRIVITGAGGQVGRLLAGEAARRGYEVSALTHREWDITDAPAAERFVAENDLVVNCAAFTNVDGAESEPDGAYAINATGAENVARACARVGARLVHISTDYVFGGEPVGGERRHPYDVGDTTNPLSVYGRTKLAGELAVLAALPDASIVRTSWVYTGGAGNDFVAVMRRLAGTDRTVDVVDDQIGSPTYAKDLVGALLEVGEGHIREPILHAANEGAVSRFEQARAVFEEVGADPERVCPVSTAQAPRPAHRPVYSALSMTTSVRAGLTPLRPWRQALADALARPADDGKITSTS